MSEPWIGFVHVQPSGAENPFGEGRKGAFTHALALASSAENFQQQVHHALSEHGLLVIELRDIAPLAAYAAEARVSEEIQELADSLSSAEPVQFDVFDTYTDHDA